MMIQVEFLIQYDNLTKVKKIQFCKKHEKNLNILYEITKANIEREKNSIEQLMIICCFHIVKGIRKKAVEGDIENTILEELSKNKGTIQNLKEIKKMSIVVRIDDIPKKILEFTSNYKNFVPNLVEPQVLR